MLLDDVVNFCDNRYSSYGNNCGCGEGKGCNHPSGECSGSCYDCLYQIHYPGRAPGEAKKVYDCPKMLYHYVCQYSYLYTTELICAFNNESNFIKDYPRYNVLSLGCGGCADLMALDFLCCNQETSIPISYIGIDVNNLWNPIHSYIKDYCMMKRIQYEINYCDVFEYFEGWEVTGTNIIIISYLISSLYNTGQIDKIGSLAEALVHRVINKKNGYPLLLIINDVNSNKRGRDCFCLFEQAIKSNSLIIGKSEYKYFDTGFLYDVQKIGSSYATKNVLFDIPLEIQSKYHAQTSINSTIQLLLEVL